MSGKAALRQVALPKRRGIFSLRLEIVQDMVVLCEKLITGEISKADVMSTDEHYCNYGSAGMYFRFI